MPPLPDFRHLDQGRIPAPYQRSRAESSVSGSQVSRVSGQRSVSSSAFGQSDHRLLHQLPGRYPLPFCLFPDHRAVGMVSREGDSSFGRIHSGERQPRCRFPLQGEVSSLRMVPEPFCFPEDLSGSISSPGDRPLCGLPQFSASQVWTGLPLYAFPPFSILPTVLEKIAQEAADVALVAPKWPQRPWFPKLLALLAGRPRVLPLQKDLIFQPLSHYPHPRLESLHLCLWPLSVRKANRLAFLQELRASLQKPSETLLEQLTIPSWSTTLGGVSTSISIPILPL